MFQINHLEKKSQKILEEKNAIQRQLKEKETHIAELNQQISSQETLIQQQGEVLHKKGDLLAVYIAQLSETLGQLQEYARRKEILEMEALYKQTRAEKLPQLKVNNWLNKGNLIVNF